MVATTVQPHFKHLSVSTLTAFGTDNFQRTAVSTGTNIIEYKKTRRSDKLLHPHRTIVPISHNKWQNLSQKLREHSELVSQNAKQQFITHFTTIIQSWFFYEWKRTNAAYGTLKLIFILHLLNVRFIVSQWSL